MNWISSAFGIVFEACSFCLSFFFSGLFICDMVWAASFSSVGLFMGGRRSKMYRAFDKSTMGLLGLFMFDDTKTLLCIDRVLCISLIED